VRSGKSILEKYLQITWLPNKIIIDRDPIFTSLFYKKIMKTLDVRLNLSIAYHAQTDGQSEWLN
jgi:hypothetical protein